MFEIYIDGKDMFVVDTDKALASNAFTVIEDALCRKYDGHWTSKTGKGGTEYEIDWVDGKGNEFEVKAFKCGAYV